MKLSSHAPKRTDKHISHNVHKSIYDNVRKLSNIQFDKNKFHVVNSEAGMFITFRAQTVGGISYADWCFGPTLKNGGVVTINAGEIHMGIRPVINVAQIDKTITTDWQYLWVEYPYGAIPAYTGQQVATIPNPSPVMPMSDETTYRCWLCQFRVIDGVVSIYRIGHLGNIELPGNYG